MTERQTLSGVRRSHLPCEKERLRRIASAAFEPQPFERPITTPTSGSAYVAIEVRESDCATGLSAIVLSR